MNKMSLTKTEAEAMLKHRGLKGKIDIDLYFDNKSGLFTKKIDFDELFKIRVFVKKRVKDKVLKYWSLPIDLLIPNEVDRLKLYKKAWILRKENNARLPNAVLKALIEKKLGKKRFFSTNKARRYVMETAQTAFTPNVETVKKYFTLVIGTEGSLEPKGWQRNNIKIDIIALPIENLKNSNISAVTV